MSEVHRGRSDHGNRTWTRSVVQMDRFCFGLDRFSNIQILNRFGALIGLTWSGFGALTRTDPPVKPNLEVVESLSGERANAKLCIKDCSVVQRHPDLIR